MQDRAASSSPLIIMRPPPSISSDTTASAYRRRDLPNSGCGLAQQGSHGVLERRGGLLAAFENSRMAAFRSSRSDATCGSRPEAASRPHCGRRSSGAGPRAESRNAISTAACGSAQPGAVRASDAMTCIIVVANLSAATQARSESRVSNANRNCRMRGAHASRSSFSSNRTTSCLTLPQMEAAARRLNLFHSSTARSNDGRPFSCSACDCDVPASNSRSLP
jgi:hypothetical protein